MDDGASVCKRKKRIFKRHWYKDIKDNDTLMWGNFYSKGIQSGEIQLVQGVSILMVCIVDNARGLLDLNDGRAVKDDSYTWLCMNDHRIIFETWICVSRCPLFQS